MSGFLRDTNVISEFARPGLSSDIRKILNKAAEHFDELVTLWEDMHE